MTVTRAEIWAGLTAAVTHTGTNVNGSPTVGVERFRTVLTGANIAYSFALLFGTGGGTASLLLSNGAVTKTSGNCTISDAATDFEGNALPTLDKVFAIMCKPSESGSGITVAYDALNGHFDGILVADDAFNLQFFGAEGIGAPLGNVAFSGIANSALTVTVIGKTA